MKTIRRFPRPLKIGFFALFFLGAVFLAGAVVMWLWNAILPSVASLGHLSYWQALGLLILCRLLFGGFSGRHRRGRFGRGSFMQRAMRKKFMNMTEEERAEFRARWKERCEE